MIEASVKLRVAQGDMKYNDGWLWLAHKSP